MATAEAKNASIGLGLAIVGAVCGTALTSVVTEPGVIRLVALCLGAAIPPFVSTVGRWRPGRAAVAMLITVVAAVITYSSAVSVTAATGEEIVPVLPGLRPPTTTQPTTPPPTVTSTHGDGALEVAPATVTCKPVCDHDVTITSTGSAPARVGTIEFDGPAKAKFTRTGECLGKTLDSGENCTFRVAFKPAGATGTQTARLVIEHDLNDKAMVVALSAEQPSLDLAVSSQGSSCVLQPGGTVDGRDALEIFFHVALTGATPEQLPGLVPVTVRSVPGATISLNTAVGPDSTGSTVAALPLSALDYGRAHSITITVDPGHKIAEGNESNNAVQLRVTLPAKNTSRGTVRLHC
ncbi:hypothetical protein CF165_07295 [Amycolatopsis vastitatis]|uniref:CARDB domain-containing protein n=2 Tax=Amycolatopsis vastitatis TaxID=1905142 RepID=A0A229TEA9_9PSEU|nr:hypothetical protein CF165_07295 [Amycolatopsis vastitatis]